MGLLSLRVKGWFRNKLAEGVGNAPTLAMPNPVFETGAASLYLPALHKMVENFWLRVEGRLALAKGFSPSSTALEAPCSVI